ncbi:MAG: DUF692 domain-containing protein [Comamonadaceae bacterium]|nr:MAG: DUF692 domain-containing protein [Comamonadaceae bacterium]
MTPAASGRPSAPARVGIGWRHPHYGELLERSQGPNRPAADFLEVHSENFFGAGGAALAVLHQARDSWPVSLHGVGLGLGSAAGIDAWHLERLAALVERIEPLFVSDHACFARGPVNGSAGANIHAADLLPIPFNDEALDVLCNNVQQVQERLKRSILVENLSAYIGWTASDHDEAAFFARLVRRTGCKLLLDINNIYVNALNAQKAGLGGEPLAACLAWLDRIPVEAPGEIHLAGHCAMDDIVIDDHGKRVCEDVWSLYGHAVARFGAVPALIEWDTDIPPLDVLLDEAVRARTVGQAIAVAVAVAS